MRILLENQDCGDLEIKCPNGNISLCPHKLAALFPNSILCIEKIGNTYQIISCNIEDTSFKRNSSILYQNFRLPDTIFIDHDIEAMKIVAKLIFNGMYSFLFYGIFLYWQSVFMIILTGWWVYQIINQLKGSPEPP